ncbi:MAG TPA: hypothetical protein VGJ60_29010 [Chloroflexota bacterium]|jgi:hypothetical protein
MMNVAPTKLPAHGSAKWSPPPAGDTGTKTGTWIACFRTEDHLNWRSTDGVWQAQLERTGNTGHLSLAFFCRELYVGRFDHRGWHAPRPAYRTRRPRPLVRSLPLPLAS